MMVGQNAQDLDSSFRSYYDIITAYLICYTERSPLLSGGTLSLSEVTLSTVMSWASYLGLFAYDKGHRKILGNISDLFLDFCSCLWAIQFKHTYLYQPYISRQSIMATSVSNMKVRCKSTVGECT